MSPKKSAPSITPGVLQNASGEVREAIRFWIMQVFAMDPANVCQVDFGGEDGDPTVTLSYWDEEGNVVEAVRPLTSPLPFDLDTLPEAADTEAQSLDPDELVDNPVSELPSQTVEESDAAAAGNG